MAHLELSGVRKVFGEHVAVESFDLDVAEGELVSFLGPSGCGKTTTLRMIAGFELPDAGTIAIDGEDVSIVPANRRNVGMVFQSYALFPNLTVADNIAFGLRMRKVGKPEAKARVAELLELIHLPDAATKYPYQLSGGMQQRVALARALAIRPRVLLLDEPLSALDAKIRVSLRQEIRSIQRSLGITTVYVTHDQEEALSMSDRVVVMSAGRIEQVGTPAAIYNAPATEFVARFVGTLNLVGAAVTDPSSGRVRILGRELRAAPSPALRAGGEVTAAIRPEAIVLGDGEPGANVLEGEVTDATFLGSIVRIRVRVEGGGASAVIALDRFNSPGDPLPVIGSPARIAFMPDALVLLGHAR